MITANVIHRVFRISCGTKAGTAFSVDFEGKQYLVTAKHIFANRTPPLKLNIWSNGRWRDLPVRLVAHGSADIDVSILAANIQLTPTGLPLEPSSNGLTYGQEVFFLGFPYGLLGKFILGDEGYPMPWVKRATVSQFHSDVYFLDGHNNRGFSGGPVVFVPPESRAFKLAGLISNFKCIDEPVFDTGKETSLTFKYNTGIIACYKIEEAVDLIRTNPIGFRLPGS